MLHEPQFVLKRVDMPEEYVEDLKTVVKEAFKPPAEDPSNTPNEHIWCNLALCCWKIIRRFWYT